MSSLCEGWAVEVVIVSKILFIGQVDGLLIHGSSAGVLLEEH